MLDHDRFLLAALHEEGLIDDAQREEAVRAAQADSCEVVSVVVERGWVESRTVAMVRADLFERPYVDLSAFDIDVRHAALLPRSAAEQLEAFPLFVIDDVATVAMRDPLDLRAVDRLRGLLKSDIETVLCEATVLRELINRAYSLSVSSGFDDSDATEAESGQSDDAPIVAAVNQIMAAAMEQGASDVHIGADERDLHIRYRIDGTLRPRQGPGRGAHAAIIQRLKVMAQLDLTQTRRPQDGKFRYRHRGHKVDVRLSLIPTVCGENAVLRLLAGDAQVKSFERLGIGQEHCDELRDVLKDPHGMLLVTGPTGSGKTTTLYAALSELNTADRHLVTIEDPVEIRLPLARQVQVHEEIGLTFSAALRSVLRQDPDVVLVGEIRDEDTARIAVQAAMTGHLVLSTLHTNDASGAIPRLMDLGCPPFGINAALMGVIAQRLVRRVCPECSVADEDINPTLMARFGLNDTRGLVRGAGCSACSNIGYRGRVGVYEMLRMQGAVREAVEAGATARGVQEAARAEGMRLMAHDGLNKARLGITSLSEVARVVSLESEPAERAAA